MILQDAFDSKEFLTVDHHAVFLVKIRIHNHIRNSCFIFQTQKDKAFRCSRPLTSDYASGYPRVLESLGSYGADAFIAKPFDLAHLTETVKHWLEESEMHA